MPPLPPPPANYGAVTAEEADAALSATRSAMAAQDEALAELAASVSRVKETAVTMEAEVRDGNREIDALGGGVGRAAEDVRLQASRVAEASSSPYTWRLFCLLIWPGVIAVLIVLHLLRKLLFGW
ncbi:hypothetical protein MMPV_006685 [Pyropia vietnamensis]